MQFRRQTELHSDGIKVRLFGEEGWNEPFVPTGGYTVASDVVSYVKNRDLVLLLPRFEERLVSDVSDELKNISVACGDRESRRGKQWIPVSLASIALD